MYNEHVSQPSTTTAPKPLSIRLNAMPFNEQAAFVESVCACLIESRFGPGSSFTFNYRLAEQPECEPAVLDDDDMTFEWTAHSRVIPPDPTIVFRNNVDAIHLHPRRFGHACITIHFQNLSPPNQGRGSP